MQDFCSKGLLTSALESRDDRDAREAYYARASTVLVVPGFGEVSFRGRHLPQILGGLRVAKIGERVRRRRWKPLPDAPAPPPRRKEPRREEERPSRKNTPEREKVGAPV